MRPLLLVLQGFRSHERRIEIDFTGRRLMAIIGPTGAGKSSVLDGICYALYAKTPRVQRDTRSLVCTRSEVAYVQLRFDVDGRVYTVTRTMGGKSQHVLQDDAGDRTMGEANVTKEVTDLLHLDFAAFCSSVLLAQNRFAEFLEAAPDKRMRILKGVFRFDQLDAMRDAAKAHRQERELELRGLDGALGQIPADVATLLEEVRAELGHLTRRLSALDEARARERDLLDQLSRARTAAEEAGRELDRLEGLRSTLPARGAIDELARDEDDLRDPLAKARRVTEEARARRRAAHDELAVLERDLGRPAALRKLHAEAQRRADALASATRLEAEIGGRRALLAGLDDAAAQARAGKRSAEESLEAVAEERRLLEAANHAHVLRARLTVGEPCPVCLRDVDVVPTADLPKELATIEARERRARAAREEADAGERAAADACTRVRSEIEHRASDAAEKAELAARIERELHQQVGDATDPLVELEERTTRLEESGERRDDAARAVDEAEQECARLQASWDALEQRRAGLADTLAHVASVLDTERPSPREGAARLAELAAGLRVELDERGAAARAGAAAARSRCTEAESEVGELRASLGVAAAGSIEEAWSEAVDRRARSETRAEQLARDAERRRKLERARATVDATLGRYRELFDDLANTRFIDFLLEDKRRVLAELASLRLQEMTGRYRFDDEGAFRVVDELNADSERDIETLSGGETFLASLALALGLAEAVTRHGGRLRCFFLDEGFGSLDPESLDRALDGIERIVRGDRLIALVSHVTALADRIPDQVVLERSEEGMSIVRRGASAAVAEG